MQTPAEPDQRFDVLARLAQRHLGAAQLLVTRIDAGQERAIFRSGFPLRDTPDQPWSGGHAADDEWNVVIADPHSDLRFHDHPLLIDQPGLRFLASCPLPASDGSRLGTLYLLDEQPRELDDEQRELLQDLACLAAAALDSARVQAGLKVEAEVLRRSERQMALAIAGSATGVWDRNIETGEIYYSTGWKALLGYAAGDISNRIADSYQRIHPDDLADVQATMQAHFEQKTDSYQAEHRIRCKDGSYRWISSRGKVVSRDDQGRALRMIGTSTDITAQRAMAERLRQSVDLITHLTDEVPGLLFQYRVQPGGESCFTYASAGIRDIYELEPEQMAGGSAAAVHALVHPDDLPAYLASLEASAASLTPWEMEFRVLLPRQGLRWRQGVARPRRLADGGTLWHGFITDVTERKRIEAELQEFATIDFLTRLPNRRHFMTQIEAELARLQRSDGQPAAVLMCDLDHFKAINDLWGHALGDVALRHFATILREQLRRSDIVGRVGGEEFAVVLSGASIEEAIAFAQRVQQRLAQNPLLQGDRRIALSISVGIATLSATDSNVDGALSRSDMALYRAKSGGRNRIECG